MTNSQTDLCPLCGGNKEPGKITFTADLGTGLVVVRRVSATVCTQCGEEWVDEATAQRLEKLVNEARTQHREVEVTAFA